MNLCEPHKKRNRFLHRIETPWHQQCSKGQYGLQGVIHDWNMHAIPESVKSYFLHISELTYLYTKLYMFVCRLIKYFHYMSKESSRVYMKITETSMIRLDPYLWHWVVRLYIFQMDALIRVLVRSIYERSMLAAEYFTVFRSMKDGFSFFTLVDSKVMIQYHLVQFAFTRREVEIMTVRCQLQQYVIK